MIALAADENFDGDVVRGLVRRRRDLDLVRIQDAGLSGAEDEVVLEWAAREKRILLTHDAATIPMFAYRRVRAGAPMPGVFVALQSVPVSVLIEDILLLAECSVAGEWDGQVRYLPL